MLCNYHHHSAEFFSSCKTETLHPLRIALHSSISPVPDNHHSTFYLYDSDYSKYLISVESYSICLFMTGLFHLALIYPRFFHVVTYQNCLAFFFFKDYVFLCGPFSKPVLNLLQYCFCFTFWFFGQEACLILAP